MAEDHGFQSPEGHRLCVNNCGFFGSPATQNMCSKCYRDICLQKSSADPPLFSPPSFSAASQPAAPPSPEEAEAAASPSVQPAANRCATCRKKVGLTGFRCRCGSTFCGPHRYAEKHGCSFDFKTIGREAIARANPLVKAHKLDKI